MYFSLIVVFLLHFFLVKLTWSDDTDCDCWEICDCLLMVFSFFFFFFFFFFILLNFTSSLFTLFFLFPNKHNINNDNSSDDSSVDSCYLRRFRNSLNARYDFTRHSRVVPANRWSFVRDVKKRKQGHDIAQWEPNFTLTRIQLLGK